MVGRSRSNQAGVGILIKSVATAACVFFFEADIVVVVGVVFVVATAPTAEEPNPR